MFTDTRVCCSEKEFCIQETIKLQWPKWTVNLSTFPRAFESMFRIHSAHLARQM